MKKQSDWSMFGLFRGIPEMGLILSSAFFLTLLFIAFTVPKYALGSAVPLYASVFVLYTYSLISKKPGLAKTIFFSLGSVSFFIFLLSRWLAPTSFFSKVYLHYKTTVEYILNVGLVGVVTYIVIILLALSLLVKVFDSLYDFTARKNLKTLHTFFGILFFALLIGGALYVRFSDAPSLTVITYSKYLIPFLGVSLIYLHGNFLVRTVLTLLNKSQ